MTTKTNKAMTAAEARAKAEELENKALENYKKALEKVEKAKAKAEKLEQEEKAKAEKAKAEKAQETRANSDSVEFEIVQHICTIGTRSTGWAKELNVVKWNGNDAKYDIREWNLEHTRMTRGITMTKNEICALVKGFVAFANENVK